MSNIVIIPGFLLIHICVGRIGSIPYGVSVFNRWYSAALIIILFDFLQILFFNFIYGLASRWKFLNRVWRILRISFKKFLRKTRIKILLKGERTFHSRMLVRAQKWGQMGVVFISAVPFVGGGMWSGVLLSRILRLGKLRGSMLLILGSITSCLVLSIGFYNIRLFIIKLFS